MRCRGAFVANLTNLTGRRTAPRACRRTAAIMASGNPAGLDRASCVAIRNGLLEWYRKEHRVLPWRAPPSGAVRPDPYAIWVSEIMSQQTQIATVEKYFSKWMVEFATVGLLAKADLDRVNEVWSGLGYYRRARMLHQGAKYVMDNLQGNIPEEVDQLMRIPGVGEYTAGAISSIAFGNKVPAVDGNVVRVVSRLAHLAEDPTTAKAKRHHKQLAAQLLQCEPDVEDFYAGDLNQSLMELGAMVCTPRKPQCQLCPISKKCMSFLVAVKTDVDPGKYALAFPAKVPKTKQRTESLATCVVVVQSQGKEPSFLLHQRPDTGLLAGLWEFPGCVVDETLNQEGRIVNLRRYLVESLGVNVSCVSPIGQVDHVFSHIRQTIWVHEVQLDTHSQRLIGEDVKWVGLSSIDAMGLPTQMRKVFALYSGLSFTTRKRRRGT